MIETNVSPRGLIIFESKYGATQQYAEWIAGDLDLPLATAQQVSLQQLQQADFLVIGTPVYYGIFKIKNWLCRQLKMLSGKKLFFFVANATAVAEQAKRDQFVLNSIPPELRQQSTVCFLPGRLVHSKLNFLDRLMLSVATGMMKDPVKKSAMKSDIDGVRKSNISEVCNAVNEFRGPAKVATPANCELQPVD